MKKNLALLVLVFVSVFSANAEEVKEYVPLLQEGKVWKYVAYSVASTRGCTEEWFVPAEVKVGQSIDIDGEKYYECAYTIEGYDKAIYFYLQEDVDSHKVWANLTYDAYHTEYYGWPLLGFSRDNTIKDRSHALVYDFNDMSKSEVFYTVEGEPCVEHPNFIEGVGYAPAITSPLIRNYGDGPGASTSLIVWYYPIELASFVMGPYTYLSEVVDADGKTIYLDRNMDALRGTSRVTYHDSVEGVDAEAAEAQEEWYNLQGVRVENPGQGMYIRRQGNAVSKVMVK